uniref:Amine oxidase domain-containing protein n=1 Tax=Acrobeloides nanus TaxID=290746 RepID=A0A914EIV7_9BILA
MFLPSLPSNKLAAIDVLGFGSNLKVFMVYDKPFWSDPNVIVPLYVEDCAQKSLLAEYIHVVEHSSWNNNVLVIWFVGKGPEIIGQLNDDKLNYEITSLFQNSLQDFSIPRAQKVIR